METSNLGDRHFSLIRDLLDGDPLAASSLGIDLRRHHLGFIVWGEGGKALAKELASALGRPMVLVPVLNQNWWGWLSAGNPLRPADEEKLQAFSPHSDAGVAVGLEAFGEAGFRATNRQALRARWVARRTNRSLVVYADVAVEALASTNQEDARAFVAHELRGIEDDTEGSARIRETIVAYFAAEHNAASAAAALGVHQQTVANRLRTAEKLLGRPVGARRLELETALRLRECLEPAP